MEEEKRKRPAARPSKQHVNKRGRVEKPAMTQGRRSKFTAMSAQTVNTSEDEDVATLQRQRCVQTRYPTHNWIFTVHASVRDDCVSTSMENFTV